ncbi:hypothetical protein Bbelb_333060 [Branchiostoma belcheri]|nr:hypothetical protein Bbelb_333060 [Branchiostoma belcheri]
MATSGGKDEDQGGLRVGARMKIRRATSGGKDEDQGGLRVGARLKIREGYEATSGGKDEDQGGLRVGARMKIRDSRMKIREGYDQSLLRGEEAGETAGVFGGALSAFVDSLSDTRVVLAISGDLSHTHPHSCDDPLYQPNPRWNIAVDQEAAGMFGRCTEGWAKSAPTDLLTSPAQDIQASGEIWDPVVSEQWLKRADELHPKALSCGIGGFWMLHAMLYSQVERGVSFSHKFLAREAPTYYGMMVTLFLKRL